MRFWQIYKHQTKPTDLLSAVIIHTCNMLLLLNWQKEIKNEWFVHKELNFMLIHHMSIATSEKERSEEHKYAKKFGQILHFWYFLAVPQVYSTLWQQSWFSSQLHWCRCRIPPLTCRRVAGSRTQTICGWLFLLRTCDLPTERQVSLLILIQLQYFFQGICLGCRLWGLGLSFHSALLPGGLGVWTGFLVVLIINNLKILE